MSRVGFCHAFNSRCVGVSIRAVYVVCDGDVRNIKAIAKLSVGALFESMPPQNVPDKFRSICRGRDIDCPARSHPKTVHPL